MRCKDTSHQLVRIPYCPKTMWLIFASRSATYVNVSRSVNNHGIWSTDAPFFYAHLLLSGNGSQLICYTLLLIFNRDLQFLNLQKVQNTWTNIRRPIHKVELVIRLCYTRRFLAEVNCMRIMVSKKIIVHFLLWFQRK